MKLSFRTAVGVLLAVNLIAALGVAAQTLQISPSGTNVAISWTGTDAWLQATATLGPPDEWTNASSVMDEGSGASVIFPADQPQEFFRLVNSPNLPPPTRAFLQVGSNFFYVYWDDVPVATSYNVYYAAAPGVGPANYQSLPGGGVLSDVTQDYANFPDFPVGETIYFVVTAVNEAGESAPSSEVFGVFGPTEIVEGSALTSVFQDGEMIDVPVSGVTVTLVSTTNSLVAASTTTDDSGDFSFDPLPYGMYQLCWTAPGFMDGCSNQLICVNEDEVQLDPIELFPNPGPSDANTEVYGHITMGDGSSPTQSDPFTQIDVQAAVTLIDSGNGQVFAQTAANMNGDYFFGAVPTGRQFELEAQVELAEITTNIDTSLVGEVDLMFSNSPPVIQSISILSNGVPVNSIWPGSTVQIQCVATDPNGYPLQFEWFPEEADVSFTDTNSATATFEATNAESLLEVEVRVSNGYGGYAFQQFDAPITAGFLLSGTVVDTNNDPIVDASVDIGDSQLYTDTNGDFELTVPTMMTNIGVAISAPGYLPLFQEEPYPEAGMTYTLYPITYSVETNMPCVIRPLAIGAPSELTVTNGGASIALQPCSLLDTNGDVYTGQFNVVINPYDPCDFSNSLPGGNAGLNASGQPTFVEPLAAATILITDTNGNPLSINPELPATVTLTTGASCGENGCALCQTTNTSLPSYYLNPSNGLWNPLPQQASSLGGQPTVWTFTSAQLGLLAVGQPAASGVINLVPDRTINVPFEVRISCLRQPYVAESFQPAEGVGLSGEGNKVTVPQNQPLTIDIINHKEGPGEYFSNPLMAGTRRNFQNKTAIIEIKLTLAQASQDVPVGLSQYIKSIPGSRVDKELQFLSFRTPTYGGTVSGQARASVDTYYGTIGGYKVNATKFGDFLNKNGFTPNAGSFQGYKQDAGALYFNAQDLGFARSMHMKTSVGADGKTNIAYFVINYTRLSDALTDLDSKGNLTNVSAQVDGRQTAVVAMDYDWDARFNKRYTKFYVFNGGPAGNLLAAADLDGGGAKFVPDLCIVCHGGSPVKIKGFPLTSVWPSGQVGEGAINADFLEKESGLNLANLTAPLKQVFANMTTIQAGTIKSGKKLVPQVLVCDPPDGDAGSRFLPFDIESFTYSTKLGVQTNQFLALNAGIFQYTSCTTAMQQLLAGWYGNGFTAASTNQFNVNFVPADWSTQAALYQNVNKLSCRACHCTRASGLGFAAFANFDKPLKGDAGFNQVCDQLTMPNAQRTFSIFWGSQCANAIKAGIVPNQPNILATKYNWVPCPTASN